MNASEFRVELKRMFTPLSICLLSLIILMATPSALAPAAYAQATIQAGSIQGTGTDPSGAVVSGAKVTITNKATGQKLSLTTNSSGNYNSGSLLPADYTVRVEAGGFSTAELATTVTVGNITPGN